MLPRAVFRPVDAGGYWIFVKVDKSAVLARFCAQDRNVRFESLSFRQDIVYISSASFTHGFEIAYNSVAVTVPLELGLPDVPLLNVR
jgi:hypothetical protein